MPRKAKQLVIMESMFPQDSYREEFYRDLKRTIAFSCLKNVLSHYKKYRLVLEAIDG